MGRVAEGTFRRLPSKRWQVRYQGPDGIRRPMPQTFATKADARAAFAVLQADMVAGRWIDPALSTQSLGRYAATWIKQRDVADRTRDLYESLLRLHIAPGLGHLSLKDVTSPVVRQWRADAEARGVGASTLAKSYSLLRAVMTTAVDDGLIARNPCRIKGAGVDPTPERPVLTLAEVEALADAIDPRWRLVVWLACFGHLRFGELMGLTRADLDLDRMVVTVRRSVAEVRGRQMLKAPKSGRVRMVALPAALRAEVVAHLERYAEPGAEGRVFVGARGNTIHRSNWAPLWHRARLGAGVDPATRLHDLRHTGNHFAAQSGASTRELMSRMGHSSMRAALIYQHATEQRDQVIAATMDAMLGQSWGVDGAGEGG